MFLNLVRVNRALLLKPRYMIYQPPLAKLDKVSNLYTAFKRGSLGRALTFQEKCLIINDPKMIAHLEVVEYGITFKLIRKTPVILFLLGVLLGTYLSGNVPHSISQRYFSVSQQSRQYTFGYFSSIFSFSSMSMVVIYIPGIIALSYTTRYFKDLDYFILMVIGLVGNYTIGNRFIKNKLSTFEVWDRFKLTAGQDFVICLISALLGYKGKSLGDLLINPSLRMFFQTIPGLGITSKGLPIVVPLVVYLLLQGYKAYLGEKPLELIVYYAVTGAIYGLGRKLILKK